MVNHRPKTARLLIQHGLGVKADGWIGPLTKKAASLRNANRFIVDHLSYRAALYHDIVVSYSDQAKYLRGWMRRIFLLQQYILTGKLA